MRVMHIALGGCLKAPPVAYGVTDDTGGHIAYILAAAEAQAALAAGNAVEIVTRRFRDDGLDPVHDRSFEVAGPGVTILRLPTRSRGYLTKEALEREVPDFADALVRHVAAASRRPDVIHAHFADAAAAALAVRDRFGIPVVYTPHSLGLDKAAHGGPRGATAPWPDPMSRRIAAERRALAEADAVVVSSRDEAERQVAAYGEDRPDTVHRIAPGGPSARGPADIASARALLAPFLRHPDRPLILAIARPVAKKNLAGLIAAYAAVPGLRDRANLAIVAGLRDGPDSGSDEQQAVIRGLLDAVDRHDLYGRLALPRQHAPADVAGLYAHAATLRGVFANPALTEPFGLTTVEAASAGLPVVATMHGGPGDVIEALGHGVTADPSDPAAFGRAIADLLSDDARWSAASRSALANISRFTWSGYAARTVDLYSSLARPADPRPKPRRIVACDIDATLTGCRTGAARFALWVQTRSDLFVVATGRSLEDARDILAAWNIPQPDIYVTAVGTEIYEGGTLRPAHWFADAIADGWAPDRIATVAAEVPGLSLQAPSEQRAFKRSWFGIAAAADALRARLRLAGVPARVVHSHDRLIDVLPARAGKAAAVEAIARRHGLTLADCIGAGDSGNDFDLLEACGGAVVVGNASNELAALTRRPGLYRAASTHAGGVMEGLAHFGVANVSSPAPSRRSVPVRRRQGAAEPAA